MSAIKRRLLLLRSGDWAKLLPELKFRTPRRLPTASPLSTDKQLAMALRASAVLTRTHSRSGAAAALSAPLTPRRLQTGDLTAAFKKLNPVAGVDSFDDSEIPRRPLNPPLDVAPASISFTVKEVLKNVRRANKAAAGGPSGTDYLTLGTWFHADDALSLSLTRIINHIAAGKVPNPIVQLLIAGRGICIPKDEKGGLRPIVVGSVLMRLVGSLAIRKESAAITQYFLSLDTDIAAPSPTRPFQFGVGVQGGCELMASAIEAHLGVNPTSIVLSCDAANAFNSVCRSKLWGVLRAKFPSLYALVRMMYGSEASIIFSEEGVPHPSVVKNSVGTRQGCSLGSMIFALMIHPYLVILAKEFPSVLILAYADDVSFVGSPEMVVACYKRWQELYTVELQGSLRDEKGVVYAQRPHSGGPPTSTLASLLNLDLPCEHEGLGGVMVPGIKVVHDGLRVLGAPIGSDAYKLAFAQARVEEVVVALETAALMPELQLQHCVSAGSLVHRINHLLRNIPGGDRFLYQEPMVRYDTAVIDVARRVARQTMLPLLAQQLASLPTRLGGLGYRTWAMTADAAFLAKYVHVSRQFQSLFPALYSQFPDVLSLGSEAAAKLISPNAACAFRALSRIEASESAVGATRSSLLRDQDRPLRHLQHVLANISEDAAHDLVTEAITESDDPAHPRHMAVHLSHCGDPTTLAMVPTCPTTTFSNDQFEAVTNRRLLLPLYSKIGSDCLTCLTCGETSAKFYGKTNFPRVDAFGDHALRCHHGSRLRIRWHDGIVRELVAAAKLACVDVVLEPSNIMLHSNDRPDLALRDQFGRLCVIADVRTAVVAVDGTCIGAAATPGHAAACGVILKDAKWIPQAVAQGLVHFSLVVEDGGTLSPAISNFISTLASKAGGSSAERDAYTSYVTQRIRAACMKGVSDILVSRVPAGANPRAPCRSLLPLAQPKPRPAASRPLQVPRPRALIVPWQSAAVPIPPGLLFPPQPTGAVAAAALVWHPFPPPLFPFVSPGVAQAAISPVTARLERAMTSPPALHS